MIIKTLLLCIFMFGAPTMAISTPWQVFLVGSYVPIGAIAWDYVSNQNWLYTRQDAKLGLGVVVMLPQKFRISARQYVILDDKIGIPGITGATTLHVDDGVLKLTYSYYYRWYCGSESDYGYAAGPGIAHRLALDLAIPLFGGK